MSLTLEKLRKHLKAISVATVCLAAAAVAGWVVAKEPWRSKYIALPAEYVYLDDARVNAYLGQLQNGLAKSEQQAFTATSATNGTATAGGSLSFGSSATNTQSIERTVTPDEGDRLYQLLEDLHRQFPGRIKTIDLHTDSNATSDLENLPESDFVELDNARLAIPQFALPVPALALGVETVVHGERDIPPTTLASIIESYPGEVKQYIDGFGAATLFPLRVIATGKDPDNVLVPTLISNLLAPSSLIGGDVTILGIVVRQLPLKVAPRTPYDAEDKAYFDASSAVAIEHALESPPKQLADVLDLPRGRNGIASLVDRAETLASPGTVILPVAIYA